MSPENTDESGALPERIGGYDVVRVLGRGGMGVVYEARQSSPARTVAVKVLHREADGAALRRFEHEAQVLGWLQHPGIAHVYEAGIDGEGAGARPFFAMELVEGMRIDHFADGHRLGLHDRLELVARVAQGLEHAHQKGVIHRDIKPANVLVRADGQPKIVDFGVARVATADGENASTLLTRVGEIVGTLGYMAPEQIDGDPSDVDVRADVYALGVLTYELLSGERPFDVTGLSVHEAMRRIVEDEPTSLMRLGHGVPEDVGTVVHKAIAKDKARRYPTVSAFAEDIRRYLRREPIEARPPSAVYQLRRLVQRHRAAAFGVAATGLALLVGAVATGALYLRERTVAADLRRTQGELAESLREKEGALLAAQEERAEADARFRELQATNDYFESLLQAPLPSEDGRDVRLADVLTRIARERPLAFEDAPRQRAWLAMTLARSFRGLRMGEEALEQIRVAAEALDDAEVDGGGGPFALERARLAEDEGRALMMLGRTEESLDALRRGLSSLGGGSEPGAHEQRHRLHTGLAKLHLVTKDYPAALEALEASAASLVEARGPSAAESSGMLGFRGLVLMQSGDVPAGMEAIEAALRAHDEEGTRRSIEAAQSMAQLATALGATGDQARAAELLEESLEITTSLVGEGHLDVGMTHANLGTVYRVLQRNEDAEASYTRAVEILAGALPDGAPRRCSVQAMRGSLRIAMGRHAEGDRDLVEVIEALEGRTSPEDVMARAFAMSYRVPAVRRAEGVDAAERLVEEALALKRSVIGLDAHPAYEIDLQERCLNAVTRGDVLGEATRELELAEFLESVFGKGNERAGFAAGRARGALDEHEAEPPGANDDTRRLRARIEAIGS